MRNGHNMLIPRMANKKTEELNNAAKSSVLPSMPMHHLPAPNDMPTAAMHCQCSCSPSPLPPNLNPHCLRPTSSAPHYALTKTQLMNGLNSHISVSGFQQFLHQPILKQTDGYNMAHPIDSTGTN